MAVNLDKCNVIRNNDRGFAGTTTTSNTSSREEATLAYARLYVDGNRTDANGGSNTDGVLAPVYEERRLALEERELYDNSYKENKQAWKQENPNDTVKYHKERYIQGRTDHLPWEDYDKN